MQPLDIQQVAGIYMCMRPPDILQAYYSYYYTSGGLIIRHMCPLTAEAGAAAPPPTLLKEGRRTVYSEEPTSVFVGGVLGGQVLL